MRRDLRGIHFIRVKGDQVERARQHAKLLREEIRNGALPVLEKKNETLIRQGPGLIQLRPVQDAVVWFYRKILVPWLDRQTDDEMRGIMRAVSEESGLPYETCRQALFQADGLMLLSRTSVMKYLMRHLPAGGLVGCSSAVAFNDWTDTGRMLVARNMDYPVVGPWERNTTVVFNEPEEKGQIPHVGVTTAGVFTSGLTAMNREGITIAAHAHFARGFALNGLPVLVIGNELIRKARTIGQAVDIVRKMRRTANWAFVVSSAKENDAVVIEMGPTREYVRHADEGVLIHSNYFHCPELHRTEALISGGCADDLKGRICRMRAILEESRGRLTEEHLTRALGDHIDYATGQERVYGNTLSVMTTVKSVVMEPGAQKMWIGARRESPLGLGDYIEVDVDRFWESDSSDGNVRTVKGYQPRNPALVEGVRHYREAYRAFHIEGHEPGYLERTLVPLRKAIAAYPEDGNLWVQAGMVAARMGNFAEAARDMEEARKRRLVPHVSLVAALFLARSYDVLGRRRDALELYRLWEQAEEPKLRAALRRGLKRRYRPGLAGNLMLDLQFPDAHQY